MSIETPTQVANPGRAVKRTAVQNLVGLLAGFALVGPLALNTVIDGLNAQGFDAAAGYVGTALPVTLFVSSMTAKVMALPGVESWLQQSSGFRWLAAVNVKGDQGPGDLGFDAAYSGYVATTLDTDESLDTLQAEAPTGAAVEVEDGAELPEPSDAQEPGEPKHRAEG